MTCAHVRLLGPCYKTGRMGSQLSPLTLSTGEGAKPERRQRSPSTACSPRQSSCHRRAWSRRAAGKDSYVPRPAGTPKGYNTLPRRSYLPSGPRRPQNRSWRCPGGKCIPAERARRRREPVKVSDPPHPTPRELNPAGPLRGPIRLLLYGFTYS